MPRTAQSKALAASKPSTELTHDKACEVMWLYYRDRKQDLVPEIRDHREIILGQLQRGAPVEQVFAAFVKPPSTKKPVRRSSGVV